MTQYVPISSTVAVHNSARTIDFDCVGRFVLLLLQLVLIAALVYLFNIEVRRHFFPVMCVIIGGFAIHVWLPMQFRLLTFAALSMACVLFFLGLDTGLWVLGIGGSLIGICYLPIHFTMRMVLLVAVGGVLAWLRAHNPQPFWPVVGSMFMFRLATFVHQLPRQNAVPPFGNRSRPEDAGQAHVSRFSDATNVRELSKTSGSCWKTEPVPGRERLPSLASSLAYFFLLPNPCFPLFPVIDYKTFCNTRYNENEWEIYQRGVTWIVRGLIHLLLYRFIKANVVPEAYQLYDITYIALFIVTNYALYLQVSGQFHLITGLLHLFGFNLPRTHHCYFLASSCSDIWRRINIYWKDFMTKYFFYPCFYALRYRGASFNLAMVGSVCFVFLATWLLHSWQTFWLLGRFPLSFNDACLWVGAGSFVAINGVIESRRKVHANSSFWLAALSLSARTVMMFLLVGLFWACWTKPGFLTLIIESLGRPTAATGAMWIVFWIITAIVVGAGVIFLLKRVSPQVLNDRAQFRSKEMQSPDPESLSPQGRGEGIASTIARGDFVNSLDFYSTAKLQLMALGIVTVFSLPRSDVMFPPDIAKAMAAFRADPTIAVDAGEKLQSYYEDLNSTKIQAGPLISSFLPAEGKGRPDAQGFYKISRQADIYQVTELIPGLETELEGSRFSVNEFGMRDRKSVTFTKPPGTIRIAFVGSSIVMGYGVSDDEVFARRFESCLNDQFGTPSRRFEVLNFGVGKQWPTHRMIRIQRKVMAFQPDVLYYFAHQDEFKDLATQPSQLIANRLELPSKYFQELADKVGVDSKMAPGAIQGRLMVHETELLNAVYKTIIDECRREGTVPVWVYLPIPGQSAEEISARLFPLARAAGFIVGDLSGWTLGQIDLFRQEAGFHPNASGHAMITEALMNMVKNHPETLPLKETYQSSLAQ